MKDHVRRAFDERGICDETVKEVLSEDALVVAAAWFSMAGPGGSTLTFQMRESRPTARSQAALDELVDAELIEVQPFNRYGGVEYRNKFNFHSVTKEIIREVLFNKDRESFPLTEPMPSDSGTGDSNG